MVYQVALYRWGGESTLSIIACRQNKQKNTKKCYDGAEWEEKRFNFEFNSGVQHNTTDTGCNGMVCAVDGRDGMDGWVMGALGDDWECNYGVANNQNASLPSQLRRLHAFHTKFDLRNVLCNARHHTHDTLAIIRSQPPAELLCEPIRVPPQIRFTHYAFAIVDGEASVWR